MPKAADVASALGAHPALEGHDVASGPLAAVVQAVGAHNEERALEAAIERRLNENRKAFDQLILAKAPPPQRGRANAPLITRELGLLVRYGAPTARAKEWLRAKVKEQQEALGEPGECVDDSNDASDDEDMPYMG